MVTRCNKVVEQPGWTWLWTKLNMVVNMVEHGCEHGWTWCNMGMLVFDIFLFFFTFSTFFGGFDIFRVSRHFLVFWGFWHCSVFLHFRFPPKLPGSDWPHLNSGWRRFDVLWRLNVVVMVFRWFPDITRFGVTRRSQVKMSLEIVVPLVETNNFCVAHIPCCQMTLLITRIFTRVGGHFRSNKNTLVNQCDMTNPYPQTEFKSVQRLLRSRSDRLQTESAKA